MWRNTRAQSVGLSRFLLSALVALVLAWLVGLVADPLLAGTPDGNRQAAEATQWLQTGVDSLFIVFLVIAVFGLVALSVYQRELLG